MEIFKKLHVKLNTKVLWLLPLIAGGFALAATVFIPEALEADGTTQPVGYVGAPAASSYVLSSTNVLPWASGNTYAFDSLVKSPINSKVYRRIVAGAGTTDPSLDATNWTLDSTQVFVIDYSNVDWSGDVHSYDISTAGVISDTENWGDSGAASMLDDKTPAQRIIVTASDAATFTPIPFQWASLTATQKTAMGASTVLDYIRGARTGETPNALGYRKRADVGGKLGDIIHSTPLHWSDGTNKTVFVGANDGMLHAFDAGSGEERFAYIPSLFINGAANSSKLRDLIANPYKHKYFVDGQLAARKLSAYTDTVSTPNLFRAEQSILVGGLGGGGMGLFALDVGAVPTTEASAATKILWEKTNKSTDYANLGHTYGTPAMVKLPDGRAAVLVGNGYNNTGNYGASLFVINAHTGQRIAEISASATVGTVTVGAGTAASPNGLSSPTPVDTNGDFKADIAYAGDIDGNLWKFDLTTFTSTLLHTTNPAQAITMAPAYTSHPSGGRMVLFATGKLFTTAEKNDASTTYYAYGIWDRPVAFASNASLLTQTLSEVSYTGASPAIRVRNATANTPDWGVGRNKGWQTALATASPATKGERVVGDGAFVTDSSFVFMATNPAISTTATPPGENWWMKLNALTGGDNGAVRFDLNADGLLNSTDQVSGASPVGLFAGGGVRSQFTVFSASGVEIFQANYDRNGGATTATPTPPTTTTTTDVKTIPGGPGVSGGHFDFDVYYGDLTKNQSVKHVHEYDDTYNVTGVNMLDASSNDFNLDEAFTKSKIPISTQFKVIVSNQYLSPAASLHLNGSPPYAKNSAAGYIALKTYATQADVAALQASLSTYTLATLKSLVVNLPVDAFSAKDWWGGALGLKPDVRVGLHPTQTGCVKTGSNNMFQPVIPPARALVGSGISVSATGNGTESTSTGVRHNGALTIQVIKANTTNAQLELSVPGSPEYGWRVKSADFANQVLAEYTMFWHEDSKLCYGDSGWKKDPKPDYTPCTKKCASATVGTDPTVGSSGTPGTPGTPGTTTTTKTNADGTTTTTTTVVKVVKNADDSTTITTTTTTTTAYPDSGVGEKNKNSDINLCALLNSDASCKCKADPDRLQRTR